VVVDAGELSGGTERLGEVEGLEYFHHFLLGQHEVFLLGSTGSLTEPIDAREERARGGPSG
jgi:hypothetical protein